MILATTLPGVSVCLLLVSTGHFLQSVLQTKAFQIHPGSKITFNKSVVSFYRTTYKYHSIFFFSQIDGWNVHFITLHSHKLIIQVAGDNYIALSINYHKMMCFSFFSSSTILTVFFELNFNQQTDCMSHGQLTTVIWTQVSVRHSDMRWGLAVFHYKSRD